MGNINKKMGNSRINMSYEPREIKIRNYLMKLGVKESDINISRDLDKLVKEILDSKEKEITLSDETLYIYVKFFNKELLERTGLNKIHTDYLQHKYNNFLTIE
jgi:hypothetical protein